MDDYPDDYMIGTYGVPDGFVLMDEDSEAGAFMMDEFGLDSNPGYADPESIDGDEGEPIPERLYMAIYVDEQSARDGMGEDSTVLLSMAAQMASTADADEVTDDPADVCEPEDDGTSRALQDGPVIAVFGSIGDDAVAGALDSIAQAMVDATGADSLC